MHKVFGRKQEGTYYERPGAYLIIFSGEKTAVVRTPRGLFFLGGRIEESENDLECIQRECLEESGYSCRVGEFLASAESYCIHERKGLYHPIQFYYMGELIKKVVDPIEKDHSLLWVDYQEVKGKMFSSMQNWALELAWKKRNNKGEKL